MREGRRQRLGLLEGTEGTVQDTYLDRIITDAEVAESAAGPFDYLKLGDDANVNVRDQRYVGDAYDYYLGDGLDDYTEVVDLETGQPDLTGGQIIDTGGGGGGQDLVTGGVDTILDTTPDTTIRDQLIDEGIQAAETDKDGMMLEDIIMPPMLDQTGQMGMDNFVDTTPDYSGVKDSKRLDARGTPISEMGTIPPDTIGPQPINLIDPVPTGGRLALGRADVIPTIDTSGNPFDYENEPVTLTGPQPGAGRVSLPGGQTINQVDQVDQSMSPQLGDTGASMDYMSGALDAPYGVNPDTGVPYETPRTIADQNRVLGIVTEEDVANPKGLLEKIGLGNLDIKKTAVMAAINKAVGAPVSLLISALQALPQYEPTFEERILEEELGVTEDGKFSGDPTESAFAGLNAVSAYGDPVETAKNRIETRLETIENNPNISTKFKNDTQKMIDEWEAVTNKLGDIDDDSTGDAQIAEDAQDLNLIDVQDDMAGIETGDASLAERIAADKRAADEAAAANKAMQEQIAAAEAAAAQAAKIEAERRVLQNLNAPGDGGGNQGSGNQGSGGESEFGGFCFDPSTPIQMADGSEKKIKEIQLGDNTKGGEVTGVFQFKATDEIHDYKGVTVAGSHYVKEDGKFIMVQDSPLSVKIDKIPVVYSLDTTGRRIFIKGIEFADYNGDGIAKGFLHNAGLELNGFNKEVLRQVENRLI